jgi:hypothetical protein
MLPSDLPSCPHCGGEEFQSWGAQIAPGFHQEGFKCPCGAFVKFIAHRGGNLLTYFRAEQVADDDLPKAWADWVNGTLLPTWRDVEERWEKHKTEEWDLWIARVFKPKFPDLDYPKGELSYYDLPDEAKAMIDETFGGTGPQKIGEYLPVPEELLDVPVPPAAPEGFAMYYRDKDGDWIWIDPKVSAKLAVPEDPILRRNREFFDAVWQGVGEALGTPLPDREETDNRYGGIEPWYTFKLAGAEFVVGWRKRVVSIGVRREEMFNAVNIRDLAKTDRVTYEAFLGLEAVETPVEEAAKTSKDPEEALRQLRAMFPEGTVRHRPGGWQADFEEANEIQVHAWGRDKTVEYLTTICQSLTG